MEQTGNYQPAPWCFYVFTEIICMKEDENEKEQKEDI